MALCHVRNSDSSSRESITTRRDERDAGATSTAPARPRDRMLRRETSKFGSRAWILYLLYLLLAFCMQFAIVRDGCCWRRLVLASPFRRRLVCRRRPVSVELVRTQVEHTLKVYLGSKHNNNSYTHTHNNNHCCSLIRSAKMCPILARNRIPTSTLTVYLSSSVSPACKRIPVRSVRPRAGARGPPQLPR